MVLFLSSTAMTMIVYGVLLGAVLGLLYRVHTLAIQTTKINLDMVDMAAFVREHLSNLEGQVTHLQAVLKPRKDAGIALEYL